MTDDHETCEAVERALQRDRRLVRAEVTKIAVLLLLVVSVWLSGYQGRQHLVDSQRQGCERSKLDRAANAKGWGTAETSRRATADDRSNSDGERAAAALAADTYAQLKDELSERSRINCEVAFPAASLLPF